MTNLKFKFYSVLKNEDAVPFIGDNILVVADGLGGAGSSIHAIDRQNHTDVYADIWSSAFGDITNVTEDFKRYVDELIAPLTDNKDHTSALWASRIVIARCVYALTEGEFKNIVLNDEKERAKLAKFIAKGLHDVAEKFNLQKGKYDGQLLLPTTLAFIRFNKRGNSIIAETVWAGDSRCYALLPKGLRLLSVDDEDNSGSITNLFYADNAEVHLNYLQHKLSKPCALMAVSDGVFDYFDPYDHLGMEQTLLSAITESNSERELSDKLNAFFDKAHSDDATMSFVSFGFSDFDRLKKALKSRTETILSIKQKQTDMQDALEVMNLSDDDASHYVMSRAADKFEHIVPKLLDAIEHNQDDIAITDEIRRVVNKTNKEQFDEVEQAKADARKQALDKLDEIVKNSTEPNVEEIIAKNDKRIAKDLSSAVKAFKDAVEKLTSQHDIEKSNLARSKGLECEKEQLHDSIRALINKYRQEMDGLWVAANNDEVESRYGELLNILTILTNAETALKFAGKNNKKSVFDTQCAARFKNKIDQKLGQDIFAYVNKRVKSENKIKNCDKDTAECQERYLHEWEELFRLIVDEPQYELVLSERIRKKVGLNTKSKVTSASPDKGVVREKVMQALRAQKTETVADIVNALAKHFDEISLIDSQFNAARLSLFRTYHRLKCQPDDGVRDLYDKLTALETEYTSLVKQCKKQE